MLLSFYLVVAATAQPVQEVLEFEELSPGCVASTATGDFGTGPILIRGVSRRFGDMVNVAVVVDTERPNSETGLQTSDRHNALYVSRIRPHKPAGVEAAWVAGSVGEIDDDEIPGAVISFDFSEVGPVTFYGVTLIDHDNHPAKLRLHRTPDSDQLFTDVDPTLRPNLTWGRKSFRSSQRRARLGLPTDETPWLELSVAPTLTGGTQQGVDLRELRPADRQARRALGRDEILPEGVNDVVKLEIELGGSSALDRIVFRRQLADAPPVDTDLFSKIEERISDSVHPEITRLLSDFRTRMEELADQPVVLAADLEGLTDDLERRLLGSQTPEGIEVKGLLQCPDLPCGCPELRALRAWVSDKLGGMRAQIAEVPETPAPAATVASSGIQIASLTPALHLATALAASQASGGQELVSDGTFFERFFRDGLGILNGVKDAVASLLLRQNVPFEPDGVLVAGVTRPCQEYRLAPLSSAYDHVDSGILPGESRRLPRGLYCIRCRTPDGTLRPFATLDLVEGEPKPMKDRACSARG